jgi:DNA-binding NarL/FixJ family response regulator
MARLGRLTEAQQAFEAALEMLRDNNGWGVAYTLYGFGALDRQRGDNAAALRHFRAALGLYREIDARPEIARCLAGIGWIALAEADLELAASSLTESIQLSLATGQRLAIARGIDSFAALAVLEEDLARAAKLAAAGAALRAAAGQGVSPAARARMDAMLDTARRQLGAAAADALVAEGTAMSAYEAVAYALGLYDSSADDPASEPAAGSPGQHPARADALAARPVSGARGGRGRAAALPTLHESAGLTTRELEITLLIARGLSNRDIAAELTISPATAARHVANIFGKLGFSSRAQVAAWAAEREPSGG